jgi:hypothetical protein
VVLIRGSATVEIVDGVVPEYLAAAERYFGVEQGRAWVAQMDKPGAQMAKVSVTPEWARILDFETRFPSALSS